MTLPSDYEMFRRDALSLGCDDKVVDKVSHLVSRFHGHYGWIELSELFAVVLRALPRALSTHDLKKSASLATWVVGVVRNDLITFVNDEVRVKERIEVLGTPSVGVYGPPNDNISCRDSLKLLSRVLSPLAWRTLTVVLASQPKRVPDTVLAVELGLSTQSVNLLRREIREAVVRFL